MDDYHTCLNASRYLLSVPFNYLPLRSMEELFQKQANIFECVITIELIEKQCFMDQMACNKKETKTLFYYIEI